MVLNDFKIFFLKGKKKLHQKEVANAFNIDYSYYNKIENDNREIPVKELQRFAEFYNISVDQLINFERDFPMEMVIEDKQVQEQL